MSEVRRIIPCLDVQGGRVVKGINFVDLQDAGDPVEHALRYSEERADELVFLDIAASAEGRGAMLELIRRTAAAISIPFSVGGGVRAVEDVTELLAAGANKVGINTAALADPELISRVAERYGSPRVIAAIDAKRMDRPGDTPHWEVRTHGGRKGTGIDALHWAAEVERLGAGEILLTSVDTDGTRDGYDLELIRAIAAEVTIPIIASGGAGRLEHLDAALQAGADAVLAASIFHFGEITIPQAREYLARRGHLVA